jgi:MtfA peptidase
MVWVLVLALLLVAYWVLGPRWQTWRRGRVAQEPFPARWRTIVRQRVALVARLPPNLQQQLRQRMQVFMAEVPFLGCDGLAVTEEMRVVVAAQACLLLIGRGQPAFDGLRHVLLYPAPFVVNRQNVDAVGLHSTERQVLAGESWGQGQVILSWPDCLEGAAHPHDGRNVVIHEFAHQLDQANGDANGAPPAALGQPDWSRVWSQAYAHISRGFYDLPAGQTPLFDDYALSAPAEFFASACEVFFERGADLRQLHPALYAQLAGFFRVDTAQWVG